MTNNQLASIFDKCFEVDRQMDFDNSGYNVHVDGETRGIYITLDATVGAIRRAVEKDCNMLLTHHPILFTSTKTIGDDYVSMVVKEAIKSGVAIYSAHTNIDLKYLNSTVANMIGIHNISPISLTDGGMYGDIDEISVREYASAVSRMLREPHIKVINGDKVIDKVAIINGAGGGDIEAFEYCLNKGIGCMITAEVKYHVALMAKETGLAVIEVGHYESEWPFVDMISKIVSKETNKEIKIVKDDEMRSPYDEE